MLEKCVRYRHREEKGLISLSLVVWAPNFGESTELRPLHSARHNAGVCRVHARMGDMRRGKGPPPMNPRERGMTGELQ